MLLSYYLKCYSPSFFLGDSLYAKYPKPKAKWSKTIVKITPDISIKFMSTNFS